MMVYTAAAASASSMDHGEFVTAVHARLSNYNARMRPRDLLLAGLFSLRRQKLRTTLTTLGVTIGIATLVASVSVGVGVRRIIEDGFKRERRLREITVYPGFDRGDADEFAGIPSDVLRVEGDMSEARRDRIRKRL